MAAFRRALLFEVIICLPMSVLRFCACNVGFVAVVEGGKVVAFVHVDKAEELLPEDGGSLAPLASPASADAELASLPMLTLTYSVAEWTALLRYRHRTGSNVYDVFNNG